MYSRYSKTLKTSRWPELGNYIKNAFSSDDRPIYPTEDWEWLRAIRTDGKRQVLDLDLGI